MKWRVARGASVKPSQWSRAEGADKGRSHTRIDISGIAKIGKEESGEF
jgi:hypothetical protein